MRKLLALIITVAVGCLTMPALAAITVMNGPSGCAPTTGAPSSTASRHDKAGTWDREQLTHVAVIISVGRAKGIPARGWTVAIATALQESGLRNLPYGDRDSIGLFQQRPSQGWGTPQQLADPAYQAGRFFDKLLTVDGWQDMPLTAAAQAVQISAFPNAYARWEADAVALINHVSSRLTRPDDLGACLRECPTGTASCEGTAAVFSRARSWLTAWGGGPVPYLSSGAPKDWFGGYRRDCSGYVSMALGLDGPGLNTSGLAAQSTVISPAQLRPGDLLINTAPNLRGHVVLFERWADTSMTRYIGFEQSGDGGTHHRVLPFPYFGGYPMTPYRFNR